MNLPYKQQLVATEWVTISACAVTVSLRMRKTVTLVTSYFAIKYSLKCQITN